MSFIEKLKEIKTAIGNFFSSLFVYEEAPVAKTAWYIDEVFLVDGLWTQNIQAYKNGNTLSNYIRKDDLRFVEKNGRYYRDIFTGEEFDRAENVMKGLMNARKIVHNSDVSGLMRLFTDIDICRQYTIEEYEEMYSILMGERQRNYQEQNASVTICNLKGYEMAEAETPSRYNRLSRLNRLNPGNNDLLNF